MFRWRMHIAAVDREAANPYRFLDRTAELRELRFADSTVWPITCFLIIRK
jgi:hypothetical protein